MSIAYRIPVCTACRRTSCVQDVWPCVNRGDWEWWDTEDQRERNPEHAHFYNAKRAAALLGVTVATLMQDQPRRGIETGQSNEPVRSVDRKTHNAALLCHQVEPASPSRLDGQLTKPSNSGAGSLSNVKPCAHYERWRSFRRQNQHVFDAVRDRCLELVREGRKYLSIKRVWEEQREICRTKGDVWRLNNNYAAAVARDLVTEVPELRGVFRMREK